MAAQGHRLAEKLSEPFHHLIALLLITLVFGGGGAGEGLNNLVVQLSALLVAALNRDAFIRFYRKAPRTLVWLVIASVALPLVQLVPMPPAIWSRLPGREILTEAMELSGGAGWYPISLNWGRTLTAFVGTLAPLTVLVLCHGLDSRRMDRLIAFLVIAACAIMLFGSLHVISGLGDLYSDQMSMNGVLFGTFADRIAASIFFVSILLLLIAMPWHGVSAMGILVRLCAALLLFTGTILTQSRSGMAALLVPLAFLAWRALALLGSRVTAGKAAQINKGLLAGAVVGIVALALGAALILSSGRAQVSLDRFDNGDGGRSDLRDDATVAAITFWPVGSGMGTFEDVYQTNEALDHVKTRLVGRAHMDYLELAVEAGAIGIFLLLVWIYWFVGAAWRALGSPPDWPARAAIGIVACIAAQSLVAYPLRNQIMLCLTAITVVLLSRPKAKDA
ncbi:hypothetical protein B2G71_22180 [Novosphingobium sp. PC22D]|nr:hypothetical protein B2G71_22180 [Novosphingobium sp. PC22D]